jgi:hypothetical protein
MEKMVETEYAEDAGEKEEMVHQDPQDPQDPPDNMALMVQLDP